MFNVDDTVAIVSVYNEATQYSTIHFIELEEKKLLYSYDLSLYNIGGVQLKGKNICLSLSEVFSSVAI